MKVTLNKYAIKFVFTSIRGTEQRVLDAVTKEQGPPPG